MDKTILLVLTNAVEGKDDEFNEWYDNRHLADVLAVPGFVAARRFKIEGAPVQGERFGYCAVYEIENAEPESVVNEMMGRVGSDAMPLSDALDGGMVCALYRPMGPRVTA